MVFSCHRCTSLPSSRTSLSGVFRKSSIVKSFSYQSPYNQESIRPLFIVAYSPSTFNTQHSTLNNLLLFQQLFPEISCRYENKNVTLRHGFLIQMIMKQVEERYISLLTDFGFKRIFGTAMNKDLLICFLNSLFNGRQVVKDV